MSEKSLQRQIWAVVALIAQPPDEHRTCHRSQELTKCFELLAAGERSQDLGNLEDRIWAIWCDHADPEARAAMQLAVQHLAARELSEAELVCTYIVRQWPEWAEGWNKRATLSFLQGRDTDSVADILCTLKLEPRHFGALGGFAQICLRNQAADAAVDALERLLFVNPSAPGVRDTIDAVRTQLPPRLH